MPEVHDHHLFFQDGTDFEVCGDDRKSQQSEIDLTGPQKPQQNIGLAGGGGVLPRSGDRGSQQRPASESRRRA
ncbi:MAG: hypothetical protein ACXW2Q_10800 [Thermoanaerobaculia bacterium]